VSDERDVAVAMLICQPFPFGGVGVASTDVLGLQVLKLRVNIVAIAHFVIYSIVQLLYTLYAIAVVVCCFV
jgi:hypothetical protein